MADPMTMMLIQLGVSAAMYAVTASQTIKGPRLSKDDRKVTLGDPGSPITRIWAKRWVTAQRIQADELHETKKKTKGKGGKYAEYKYDGSWLDHFTDTPVDAITKLKFDTRLVYQRTGVGPVSSASVFALIAGTAGVPGAPVKLQQGKNFALYTGAQTAPDPYYEQWCEEEYGMPGMAPAFLNETYAKFYRVPLEKFGNRLPNVEAELVRNKTDAYLMESIPQLAVIGSQFTPDRRFLFTSGPGPSQYSVFDVAQRVWIFQGVPTTIGHYSVGPGGLRYGVNSFFDPEVVVQSMGGGETILFDDGVLGGALLQENWYAGGTVWFKDAGGSGNAYHVTGSGMTVIPVSIGVDWIAEDLNGNVWAGGDDGAGIITFECISGGGGTFSAASPTGGNIVFFFNEDGNAVVMQGSEMLLVDPVAGSVIATAPTPPVVDGYAENFREVLPGSRTIWIFLTEYDARDLSVTRTVNVANYTGPFATQGAVYSRLLDAIILKSLFADESKILYLDRVSDNGVQFSDVITDVCSWAGIPTDGAISAATCTQPVPGYSVQQSNGRAMLDPLMKLFDSIARPHDFTIEFKPRGDAPVGRIESKSFVRSGSSRYTATKVQASDLPKNVTVVFSDLTKEDQRNTVIADQAPEATGSDREDTVDLNTFSDHPDNAQQKADRYLRRLYCSREQIGNSLSAQCLAYEPGDVITLALDGDLELDAMLDKMVHSGPLQIECEFTRDIAAAAQLNTATVGPPLDAVDEQEIYIPAWTQGFEIDGPLLRDVDDDINPLVYFAAGPFGSPWPGAAAWRQVAGIYDELNASFDSTQGAMFGFAKGVLGTADPWLWDQGNTLDVTIFGGTLTTHTVDECDQDETLNLLILGKPERWEYLQFATATLLSASAASRVYRLQGFKRGRRGTEAHVGDHVAGDDLLVYNAGDIIPLEYGADELGNDMSFKTATLGVDPDLAASVDFTFAGNTLKPYAPCQFVATRDPATGDWLFTWIRRTRRGGVWSSAGTPIPLAEVSEAYELEIPITGAARTISAATPTATWTAAEQAADYGAPQAALPAGIAVYQLSDVVGRGFASPEPLAA